MADDRVYILDMFNHEIYPNDEYAKSKSLEPVDVEPMFAHQVISS